VNVVELFYASPWQGKAILLIMGFGAACGAVLLLKDFWKKLTEKGDLSMLDKSHDRLQELGKALTATADPNLLPPGEVQIIVRGNTGTGKSALLGKIEEMLTQAGIACRYANVEEARHNKAVTTGWDHELAMYKPSVVLIEETPKTRSQKAYEEGRQARRDGLGISDNPYVVNIISQPEADQWMNGYNYESLLLRDPD
jgi:hypothetical protein